MTETQINKLRNDIVEGMKASSKKLKDTKKRLDQNVVISENGEIKEVEAKNLK